MGNYWFSSTSNMPNAYDTGLAEVTIHSDGKMTDMSVLTEAADLATVLDGLKELPQIDKRNIFLMGRSQGGYVSTYVGTKRRDEIRGMVLLYPAYMIQDDVIERTDNGKHIAKEPVFLDYRVGEIYDRDALAVDIYEGMSDFTGSVLLIHGTADPLVPYAYSLKARELFPNAELVTVPGAGHGFEGEDLAKVKEIVLHFVQENIV